MRIFKPWFQVPNQTLNQSLVKQNQTASKVSNLRPENVHVSKTRKRLGLNKKVLCDYFIFDNLIKSKRNEPKPYFGFWPLESLQLQTKNDQKYGLIQYEYTAKDLLVPAFASKLGWPNLKCVRSTEDETLAIYAFSNLNCSFEGSGSASFSQSGLLFANSNEPAGFHVRPSSELRTVLADFSKKCAFLLNSKGAPTFLKHHLKCELGKFEFGVARDTPEGWSADSQHLPSLISYGELRKVPFFTPSGIPAVFQNAIPDSVLENMAQLTDIEQQYFVQLELAPTGIESPAPSEILTLLFRINKGPESPLLCLEKISTEGLRECRLASVSSDPTRFDFQLQFKTEMCFGDATALYQELLPRLTPLNEAESLGECADIFYNAFTAQSQKWSFRSCNWFKQTNVLLENNDYQMQVTQPLVLSGNAISKSGSSELLLSKSGGAYICIQSKSLDSFIAAVECKKVQKPSSLDLSKKLNNSIYSFLKGIDKLRSQSNFIYTLSKA